LTALGPKSVTSPEASAQRVCGADAVATYNHLKRKKLFGARERGAAARPNWHD
jgi:hypothetical protein